MEEKTNLNGQFEKSMMARYLIHVVGDVHQPLHAACLINELFPDGDFGGNEFKIIFSDNINNLHKLFDSGIGRLGQSPVRPLNQSFSQELKNLAQAYIEEFPKTNLSEFNTKSNSSEWIEESHDIAQDFIYKNSKINSTQSEDFLDKSYYIVKRRISLGGYRLAELFKDIKRSYDSVNKNHFEIKKNEIDVLLKSKEMIGFLNSF